MTTLLATPSDLELAREFLARSGLSFEEGADEWAGVFENGELAGVGARSGNVLKMLAVAPAHQGGPILGEIATHHVRRLFEAGFGTAFVFTKPEYATTFEALNFRLLANQGRAVLLEYGEGLDRWLRERRPLLRPGRNGAVVANANPFTRGHGHLVRTAAGKVDHLYLFIVREDRSVFPFDVRFRLAAEAVGAVGNVTVLDTGPYSVSAATFPSYFLRNDDSVARIQMELDAELFASKLAPFFGIAVRWVGTEPYSPMTASYNEALARVLPSHGVGLERIDRIESGGGAISASRVRSLFSGERWAELEALVPAGTLAYLKSADAAGPKDRLRRSKGEG